MATLTVKGIPDLQALLARLDILQKRVSLPPLTDEWLQKARTEGRP